MKVDIEVVCPHCGYKKSLFVEMDSDHIWEVIHCQDTIMDYSTNEWEAFGCGKTYVAEIGWVRQIHTFELNPQGEKH